MGFLLIFDLSNEKSFLEVVNWLEQLKVISLIVDTIRSEFGLRSLLSLQRVYYQALVNVNVGKTHRTRLRISSFSSVIEPRILIQYFLRCMPTVKIPTLFYVATSVIWNIYVSLVKPEPDNWPKNSIWCTSKRVRQPAKMFAELLIFYWIKL